MSKHKDLVINDVIAEMESVMSPEAVKKARFEAEEEIKVYTIDHLSCTCGGTFVLVGRSQDANTIYEVYECDLCKAKKMENKSK